MSKITDYRIVLSAHPQFNERRAASFIRENIKLVCGKKIPLVSDEEAPVALEIVVGKTNREVMDGMNFPRARGGLWEYVITEQGSRLYVTGLGTPPEEEAPYDTAYRKIDDGAIGTVMAANHFVEDVLGYDFVYSAYDEFPEDPDLKMPAAYDYHFTREAMRKQRPAKIDGAALYSLNCVERLDWNIGSFILKTREGKLIVIDGGHTNELPRLVECLKSISGEEVPTVTAWLFSHLHDDHCGAYVRLSNEEQWHGKIIVKDVYCNFMGRDFGTKIARVEANASYGPLYDSMMGSDKTLGASIHVVKTGDVIDVDEISFAVLHAPDPAEGPKMNLNDSSVVYKMTYDHGQSVLFLGDAEWVCSNDLVDNHADALKSDVVQVGHHGCGNVSRRCYELIDAKAYIWQCGERFWYQDCGEGTNTHNVGYVRYRAYMKELGVKRENVYVTMDHIDSFPLPMPIAD